MKKQGKNEKKYTKTNVNFSLIEKGSWVHAALRTNFLIWGYNVKTRTATQTLMTILKDFILLFASSCFMNRTYVLIKFKIPISEFLVFSPIHDPKFLTPS